MQQREATGYTLPDIEEGLDTLAVIIKLHGEKYLPLFKVLLEERERLQDEPSMLEIALRRAENVQLP